MSCLAAAEEGLMENLKSFSYLHDKRESFNFAFLEWGAWMGSDAHEPALVPVCYPGIDFASKLGASTITITLRNLAIAGQS